LSISDEQLIAKYQATRASADLDELFARHLQVVRNLAYRIVMSNSAADDITQEVFICVFRNAHTFRGDAKFSTWLYQITMNATKAYFRKQTHRTELPDEDLKNLSYTNNPPDQRVMHNELTNEIERALAKLSRKLRTAIILTSIEHLSASAAAKIESCSVPTMHWRVHQARKQLKQHLHRYLKS
jgi:RNA polymerase sigma-70 factor (ECF subfamily)